MSKPQRRYYFVARNEKTAHGYRISFPNIPNIQALGTTYEETVYYAYRVLSDFLNQLPASEAAIFAYTLSDIPDEAPEGIFYSLVSVTPSFDPHQMYTHFTLAQTVPDGIRRKAALLAGLVDSKRGA